MSKVKNVSDFYSSDDLAFIYTFSNYSNIEIKILSDVSPFAGTTDIFYLGVHIGKYVPKIDGDNIRNLISYALTRLEVYHRTSAVNEFKQDFAKFMSLTTEEQFDNHNHERYYE
jgi:hypothetical protein